MTTKLHLAATPDYRLVEGQLTGGNVADIAMADPLTADVFGCFVVEDRGYDSDDHRDALRASNNVSVIPGRKNKDKEIVYGKIIYQGRSRIEILFGKIKENRRFAVRYEKTDLAFLGFIAIAPLMIHLC